MQPFRTPSRTPNRTPGHTKIAPLRLRSPMRRATLPSDSLEGRVAPITPIEDISSNGRLSATSRELVRKTLALRDDVRIEDRYHASTHTRLQSVFEIFVGYEADPSAWQELGSTAARADHEGGRSRKKAWPKQPTIVALLRYLFPAISRQEVHRRERILTYLSAEGVPCAEIAHEIDKRGGIGEVNRAAVAAYPRQPKKARVEARIKEAVSSEAEIKQAGKIELKGDHEDTTEPSETLAVSPPGMSVKPTKKMRRVMRKLDIGGRAPCFVERGPDAGGKRSYRVVGAKLGHKGPAKLGAKG
jgi:hypothetical protein